MRPPANGAAPTPASRPRCARRWTSSAYGGRPAAEPRGAASSARLRVLQTGDAARARLGADLALPARAAARGQQLARGVEFGARTDAPRGRRQPVQQPLDALGRWRAAPRLEVGQLAVHAVAAGRPAVLGDPPA